ncbi:hypothetical protein ACTWQE_01435 [Streptomyces sp. 8N706]
MALLTEAPLELHLKGPEALFDGVLPSRCPSSTADRGLYEAMCLLWPCRPEPFNRGVAVAAVRLWPTTTSAMVHPRQCAGRC